MAAENFRQLGMRNVFPISAEHGLGIGDLLDAISDAIPDPEAALKGGDEPDVATAAGLADEDELEADSDDLDGGTERRCPSPHARRV